MRKAIILVLLVSLIIPFTKAGGSVDAQPPAPYPQLSSQQAPAVSSRIAPDLQADLDALPAGEMLPVIVTLTDQADLSRIPGASRAARQQGVIRALQAQAEASQKQIQALLKVRSIQGKVSQVASFWVFNGLAVTATQDVIEELAARADVAKITPDEIEIEPVSSLTLGPAETNLAVIKAPDLWSLDLYGQGVVVANMDSGVDASHPDLSGRWRGGTNSWFDPHGEHPLTPTDLQGHGTWTMGVMVGGDAGGTSIGAAPQAQWIAVKIFNDSGSSTATAIHQGFQWLMDPDGSPSTPDAPHVVNNSWTFSYPGCDLEFELDLQSLRAVGILPVFAAGNGGPGAGTSYSPANNPSAFAVGGTNDSDYIYAYSSRGPSSCGEPSSRYPEMVAPGVGVRTTGLYGFYDNATGTSLAAPHVAGGLALLLSAYPNLSDTWQENALINGAVDLGDIGPDNDFGYGRLDILASYQWLANAPTPTPTATPDPNTNLALNKAVTVSSIQDDSHNGDMAVDGALSTYWRTQKASGKNTSTSEWITVDLGSSTSIGRVVLEWDRYYATNYSLQVSPDDSTWTTVYSEISGNGGQDTITFAPTSARYVRIESTAWSSGSQRNWLREFEIYAGSGGPLPTDTPVPTATPTGPTPTHTPTPEPTATPGTGTSMHLGDLDGLSTARSRSRWDAQITITVHDSDHNPVTGATVSGVWSQGASGGGTCLTDADGTCSITKSNLKSNVSSVTFTVETVSHSTMQYVPGLNHDPDGNGTSVVVSKP